MKKVALKYKTKLHKRKIKWYNQFQIDQTESGLGNWQVALGKKKYKYNSVLAEEAVYGGNELHNFL